MANQTKEKGLEEKCLDSVIVFDGKNKLIACKRQEYCPNQGRYVPVSPETTTMYSNTHPSGTLPLCKVRGMIDYKTKIKLLAGCGKEKE